MVTYPLDRRIRQLAHPPMLIPLHLLSCKTLHQHGPQLILLALLFLCPLFPVKVQIHRVISVILFRLLVALRATHHRGRPSDNAGRGFLRP